MDSLERNIVVAGALLVAALGWWYLAFAEASMASAMFGMPGMSGWTALDYWLAVLMWVAMMAGMMLPSALPVILLYRRLTRRAGGQGQQQGQGETVGATALFGVGYLIVWTGFSILAAMLQGLLAALSLTTGDSVALPWLAALVLVAAGLYQWSSLKQACLASCRAPVEWLAHRWRKGRRGALAMGLEHGAYCVGCCWALMALLFVFGVMNLAWVAALALFVLLEKVAPFGGWLRRVGGFAFIAAGIAFAVWG